MQTPQQVEEGRGGHGYGDRGMVGGMGMGTDTDMGPGPGMGMGTYTGMGTGDGDGDGDAHGGGTGLETCDLGKDREQTPIAKFFQMQSDTP